MGSMNPVDNYLTTKEAADILGISRSRMLDLIRAKRLPTNKVGGIHLIKIDDLELVKDRRPGYPKGRKRKPDPE